MTMPKLKWVKEQSGCYWTELEYTNERYFGGVTLSDDGAPGGKWHWWIELKSWKKNGDCLCFKMHGYRQSMKEARQAAQDSLAHLRAGLRAASYRIDHPEA